MEKLYTAKEVAESLQVSEGRLASWRIHGGGPKFIRLGEALNSKVRYRAEDIAAFLDERSAATEANA